MNATISAEIANQRHAELVAQAAAYRASAEARRGRRPQASATRADGPLRRRRPVAAVFQWIAAGQL